MTDCPHDATECDCQPTSYQAMKSIEAHARQMPFTGLTMAPIPDAHRTTPEDFIIELADWFASYRAVIARQSDEFTRQGAKLNALIDQRDAVRRFFGTAEIGAETSLRERNDR